MHFEGNLFPADEVNHAVSSCPADDFASPFPPVSVLMEKLDSRRIIFQLEWYSQWRHRSSVFAAALAATVHLSVECEKGEDVDSYLDHQLVE